MDRLTPAQAESRLRSSERPLRRDELQRLLHDVAPAAFLATPVLLRRIIKADCVIGGVGIQVPHRKTYSLARDALLAIVDPAELGVPQAVHLPDHLLLLSCSESRLAQHSRDRALVHYWRLVFHARIDQRLQEMRAEGKLDDARIRSLIQHLGPVAMAEATRVLRGMNFLLDVEDHACCFCEFVAVFLELRFFAPHLVVSTFPGIDDPERVQELLEELVDSGELYSSTRLAGAPNPVEQIALNEAPKPERSAASRGGPWNGSLQPLLARASVVQERGNVVRAAILRTRAASVGGTDGEAALQAASEDLDRLVKRLQAALAWSDETAQAWRVALAPLLVPASQGIWPAAARLLYDLQKVCIDRERELFAVDVVEWVCSLGRKAIKRPVPLQAEALLVKHLRSASARLPRISGDSQHLSHLLHEAIDHAEEQLRARIRPMVSATLTRVGLQPDNLPESLAAGNIVEELLDRVSERGFLNMGDLRDAISRNQLKLPDATPLGVLIGDPLLRANRQLAISLDGVYHRGEVYLRWLQRLSSLLFGNPIGRWLVLFVVLPFGGSFATAVFLQEMFHVVGVRVHVSHVPAGLEAISDIHEPGQRHHGGIRVSPESATTGLVVLGVFYVLVLHVPRVRRAAWDLLQFLWRVLRGVFYDGPVAFVALPAVRAFLDSPPIAFFRRRVMVPLMAGMAAGLGSVLYDRELSLNDFVVGAAIFVLALFCLNSRLSLIIEEAMTLWLGRHWHWLRLNLIPQIVEFFIWFFKMVLDRIERGIYAVDEWLRFRRGDSRFSLVGKLLLGLIWFILTYLLRIIINLFVEPTVNPVKHFPAVTVGAKLIIPMIPAMSVAITELLRPFVGVWLAGGIAGTCVILLPGIFGFAVWEFKENWKLYRANRPRNLHPMMIGHHGETMIRLLEPGIHSGTLPKLFAKLRKAEQRDQRAKIARERENLHHITESVGRFIERELVDLLKLSKSWGDLKIEIGQVKLATNRISIELGCAQWGTGPVMFRFAERDGWLEAYIDGAGWLDRLSPGQRAAFRVAVAGWYKLAGVTLVREQIEAVCPDPYVVSAENLFVYPHSDFAHPVSVPLQARQPHHAGSPSSDLSAACLLFYATAIPWTDWVAAWEMDREGRDPALPGMEPLRLLPGERC